MTLASLYSANRNSVTLFRLALALAVVFSHFFSIFGIQGEPVVRDFDGNTLNLGFLAVRGFFGISGFVIMLSALRNPKASRFFVARARRILPAYALVFLSTLLIVIPLLIAKLGTNSSDWSLVGSSMLRFFAIGVSIPVAAPIGIEGLNSSFHLDGPNGIPLNASLWTLPIEIKSYFLIWLLLSISFKFKYFWIIYVASLFMFKVFDWEGTIMMTLIPDFSLVLTFMGGALIAQTFGESHLSVKPGALLLLALCLCSFSLTQIWLAELFFGVGLSIAVPLTLKLLTQRDWLWKSDFSYGTYLWGWPVCVTFHAYFPDANELISFFLCLLLTLFFAALSWRFVEKRFIT